MEILRYKNGINNSTQSFTGYKTVQKEGEKAVKYVLKKKEFQYIDTLSFLTAVTSSVGFAVGGAGLLTDHFYDLKNKKTKQPQEKTPEQNLQIPVSTAFKDFSTDGKQISYKGNEEKKEGAKTIVPSTTFAKIGLLFAKVGIAFSGIAGIFNGLSMGLPLMAAGEALNLGASPIIETPLGIGLFHIALAAVFSGRALEHDPKLKMDKVKLSQQKGLGRKALYILNNMKGCVKEVWNTTKIFGKNIGGLFSKAKRPDSISFFRDTAFSIKPKKIVIQEFIDEKGVVTVKKAFKNNPYLMHTASLVLATGGLTLALSSIFKKKKGQKIGLRTCETGGSLDNLGLSRSGLEKVATSSTLSGKVAGNLLGLSGLTIMAGQPALDEKWGRGTQWIGTSLLFAVFAVERTANAFKIVKEKSGLTSLIRQTEIDLTKLYTKSELSAKIEGSKFKTRLDSIINMVKGAGTKEGNSAKTLAKNTKLEENFKAEENALKNERFQQIVEAFETRVKEKAYDSDYSKIVSDLEKTVTENNPEFSSEKFKNSFKKEGNDGDLEELKTSLRAEAEKIFQKA